VTCFSNSIQQFENFFVKFLNSNKNGWSREAGSEGNFNVDRNKIDLELNIRDEVLKYSGFHKEIKL
jgi:hypothetical protein